MLFHLDSPPAQQVELLHFRDVKNAPAIRQRILSGELNFAALNSTLVFDAFPVLAAVQLAVSKSQEDKLICRNIASEIVYNVSATRNIAKGLAQFGIGDTTDEILVVILEPSKSELERVRQAVDGTVLENCLESLPRFADTSAIRKVYDITSLEESISSLVGSIVTRIAVREIK